MLQIYTYDLEQKKYDNNGLSVQQLPEVLENPSIFLWVDFDSPTPEETGLLDSIFHLDALAIEDCLHQRQLPKLESFRDYHFFIVQGMGLSEGDAAGIACPTIELKGFLADRYLITYHDKPVQAITDAKRALSRGNSRLEQGTAYHAYEILDQIIDMYLPVLDHLEEKIRVLTWMLQTQPFNDQLTTDYRKLSTSLLDLRRVATKNQQVFYLFSHSSLKFIDPDEARLFRDIYDHMIRVMDMSEYYQHTLNDLLNIQLSMNSNRMNQNVQFLTIWATIMLPLNVMTGIYGMNFDRMPLLHSTFGFPLLIAGMFLVIAVMLFYFRRRGWI